MFPEAAPLSLPGSAGDDQPWYVLRVYVRDAGDVARLTSGQWDVLESRGPDYLRVLGDASVAQALRGEGYAVEVDEVIGAPALRAPLTYYGGYRTVTEHEQHLAAVAAAHPGLAVVVDYGDSWRRVTGRSDGHDLWAVCITKVRPGDCALSPETDKPRFLLIAGLHARELAPPEVAWRWIDFLVDRYSDSPDVAYLLDTAEMWVVPLANPDGRAIVESGGNSPLMQRKNADTGNGNCVIPNVGVDLNRNAGFQWGVTGASSSPCDQVYKGPAADSEPETQALNALMAALFRDQREPALSAAAPLTTSGILLSLHSYGNLVMLPWDWTTGDAPNAAGLRGLAFRMSYYNGYKAGQSSEVLYLSSGTTEDWAYGQLGVPSFTFELGSSFMPGYSTVDAVFWPRNLGALLFAAKTAYQPYALGLGPMALTPTTNLTRTQAGQPVTLTATIDDRLYGSLGSGRPASQAIAAAEYTVDALPWSGGVSSAMAPSDGAFDAPVERVEAAVDTELSAGRHTLFVRGRDADGHWGPVSAIWLTITRTYTISGAVTDRLTGESLTATVEITGSDPAIPGSWIVTDVASAGLYSLTVTSGPAYTLTVAAAEYLTATLGLGYVDADRFEPFALLPLSATVKVFVPLLVQPDALVR